MHEHDIVRNAELRKFRREQLLQRQNLEKVLLTEVRMTNSFIIRGLAQFFEILETPNFAVAFLVQCALLGWFRGMLSTKLLTQ